MGPSNPMTRVIDLNSTLVNDPAVVFLPSHSTEDDCEKVITACARSVLVTGSAALGKVGPPLGSVDIAESKDSYLFRVALPGVIRDDSFYCNVDLDGTIVIGGITSTGEKTVEKFGMVFEMQTQNLCPPGKFSISFKLPGPIDQYQLKGTFQTDGTFEAIAKKRLK